MNVELSERECRTLLDILHIADVVVTGHHTEPDIRVRMHRELIQKLYAVARKAGFSQLISTGSQGEVPTAEFEKTTVAHAVIDEFGNHLFWDELIDKLTARDAARMVGGMERLNAMSEKDRALVEGPIRKHYVDEFTQNGMENIVLIKNFVAVGDRPVRTSD